jgi:hypothetical protein
MQTTGGFGEDYPCKENNLLYSRSTNLNTNIIQHTIAEQEGERVVKKV